MGVSIRSKIMIPFILALAIMAASCVYVSITIVREIVEKQLLEAYDEKSVYLTLRFNEFHTIVKDYADTLADGIAENKRPNIPITLLERDHVRIIWGTDELSDIQAERYKTFFTHPGHSPIIQAVALNEQSGFEAFLTAYIPAKDPQGVFALAEMPLNARTLSSHLIARKIERFGLFYVDTKMIDYPELITASTDILHSTAFQQAIRPVIQSAYLEAADKDRFIATVTIQENTYKVIARKLNFTNGFYSAVLMPLELIDAMISKILFFILGIMLGIVFVITIFYALVIRRITTSIDILGHVAKKVATGDLNQKVFISTKDEIGALSSIFNEMVYSLKNSSQILSNEKKQSDAIISFIPEGILVIDFDHNLILANQQAERLFHSNVAEILHQPVLSHIRQKELKIALKTSLKAKSFPHFQEVTIQLDKQLETFKLTTTEVKDEYDVPFAYVTVLRDITHEKELISLQDSFLRTVSHELRTPLTSIMGFIELIKSGKLDTQQKDFLQIALDESHNLKLLIDDLLDLSRIEAGKMPAELTEINCKEMIDGVIAALLPLTKGKNLKLKSGRISSKIKIQADFSKFRRILANLVSNAIKFTSEGEITLGCKMNGDMVQFSVKDTGIGLQDHEKDIIFEKFRQVDYSDSRQYEGIGLGLSIVKELVELHHGKVWVDSEYEKGSTFYFEIPKRINDEK